MGDVRYVTNISLYWYSESILLQCMFKNLSEAFEAQFSFTPQSLDISLSPSNWSAIESSVNHRDFVQPSNIPLNLAAVTLSVDPWLLYPGVDRKKAEYSRV